MSDLTDRVHDQCGFEICIANRLRFASRAERTRLYSEVYAQYADRYPEHLPTDSRNAERVARYETSFLRRFLTPTTVMLEIGPGRCHLAFAIAPLVAKLYGVDVAEMSSGTSETPPNFELRLTDGLHMPFANNSIDLVFSNQLMEHLHPDDAIEQLQEIHRILRKNGSYICITPSRVNGPHDCSAYFDDLPCPIQAGDYQAIGLHLKEYTTSELLVLFRQAGFRDMQSWIGARGSYIALPAPLLSLVEYVLRRIPAARRKRSRLLSVVLGNRIHATK